MYISPCVTVCKINQETRKCEGCNRTIDEIRDWTKYTDDERMAIMKKLGYGKRKGKRIS